MEYIPHSNSQRFEHGSITSWEYEMQHANLNLARISIKGRYPENGYTRNTLSDSIIHVVDGNGVLATNEGTTIELTPNDQVHLAVGDAYYFEGDLNILYAATPAWVPGQTEHILE